MPQKRLDRKSRRTKIVVVSTVGVLGLLLVIWTAGSMFKVQVTVEASTPGFMFLSFCQPEPLAVVSPGIQIPDPGAWVVLVPPGGKLFLVDYQSPGLAGETKISRELGDIRTRAKLEMEDGAYRFMLLKGSYFNYPTDEQLTKMERLFNFPFELNCQ